MERALVNVDRADKVYFMPDWILSNGCAEEFETAFRHDKEISFYKTVKSVEDYSMVTIILFCVKNEKDYWSARLPNTNGKDRRRKQSFKKATRKKQCTLYPKILKNLIRSKSYGWREGYKFYLKGTPQEECADCFIAISGLRNCTDGNAGVIRRMAERAGRLLAFRMSAYCI